MEFVKNTAMKIRLIDGTEYSGKFRNFSYKNGILDAEFQAKPRTRYKKIKIHVSTVKIMDDIDFTQLE